jgi:pyruvate-formate lyase-activating enzyme
MARFRLYLGHHPLANEDTISHAWKCAGGGFALEHSSGVTVYLSEETVRDTASMWRSLAKEYPEVTTATVRGVTASVADPLKSTNGTAKGGVELSERGIRISVVGNGNIPVERLEEVMESLRQE